jgi:hypothetical protein
MSYDLDAMADAGAALAPISAGGFGQVVTLTHESSPVRSADTGDITSTPTTQTGSGVSDFYKPIEIDGARIQGTDLKFYLSPLNAAGLPLTPPSMGDTLTDANGKIWRIMNPQAFAPAGTVVFTILQLRGTGQ